MIKPLQFEGATKYRCPGTMVLVPGHQNHGAIFRDLFAIVFLLMAKKQRKII